MFKTTLLLALSILILSCDSKPKIIAEDTSRPKTETGVAGTTETGNASTDVHQVVAKEILNTDRYTYLKVTEGTRTFWVATSKMDAQIGKSYMYRGGLLKVNFESQEFKRNFDTIYLVSQVIDADRHTTQNTNISNQTTGDKKITVTAKLPEIKGAIKLNDLISNKSKYKDKVITVRGEVIKVNNGIMGKNWVHITDISGKELTITTNSLVEVGNGVAFKGKIAVDKDFGAGYRYELIMEEAELVKVEGMQGSFH